MPPGRHPHVDDRHVRLVRCGGPEQRVAVSDRGDDIEAAPGQRLGQPVAHDRGVLGDNYA